MENVSVLGVFGHGEQRGALGFLLDHFLDSKSGQSGKVGLKSGEPPPKAAASPDLYAALYFGHHGGIEFIPRRDMIAFELLLTFGLYIW